MSYPVFTVPASTILYIPFATYAGATGASVTMTGLAVTDIEIYKNGSVTQRSSDSGYALLDTDGIDFDGITGIHGFSVDLSDNTDAGFYAAGSWYWIVVSAVTVDSQTVNFIAAMVRIVAAEGTAGTPSVDAARISNSATAADNVETAFASTLAEVAAVPAANAPIWTKLNWLFALGRNKITQSTTTQTLRDDADTATIATAAVSDSAGTYTRGEWT